MTGRLLSRFRRGPAEEADGAPIFFMAGSLRDCSAKDALAYARGLIERYITAPEVAWLRVLEDKVGGRVLYEIHEGGPGLSVLDGIQQALRAGRPVNIALTNGRVAVVDDSQGELYTLIYPAPETPDAQPADGDLALGPDRLMALPTPAAGTTESVRAYASSVKLTKVYQEGETLPSISALILILSSLLFMVTGATYTLLQAGVFTSDSMLAPIKAGHRSDDKDNPVWQLESAKRAADKSASSIKLLRKDSNKGWTWELTQ